MSRNLLAKLCLNVWAVFILVLVLDIVGIFIIPMGMVKDTTGIAAELSKLYES